MTTAAPQKSAQAGAKMIQDILQAMKASGTYVSGDTFLMLAFRTEDELRQICAELHIKPHVLLP